MDFIPLEIVSIRSILSIFYSAFITFKVRLLAPGSFIQYALQSNFVSKLFNGTIIYKIVEANPTYSDEII